MRLNHFHSRLGYLRKYLLKIRLERRQRVIINDKYLDDLLRAFNPLIHKTMNRLKIYKNHMDYDDFIQELQIQLIEILHQFDGDPLASDEECFKFTAYAKNGLYWHGLNLLKQRESQIIYVEDEKQLDWMTHQDSNLELISLLNSNLHIQDFLKQARKRLTYEDYLLLMFLVEGEYSMADIAEFLQITISTIYERKKKIQQRLQGIKNCLIN